jgi:hypothetical protein
MNLLTCWLKAKKPAARVRRQLVLEVLEYRWLPSAASSFYAINGTANNLASVSGAMLSPLLTERNEPAGTRRKHAVHRGFSMLSRCSGRFVEQRGSLESMAPSRRDDPPLTDCRER